jgi:hypothetical protein
MDPRLQEMLDHYEIRKTLSEYCNACDRADEPRIAAVYAEDSWDEHGLVRAPGPEFARIMGDLIVTTSNSLYHLLGQSLVKIDGDDAGAETYFLAISVDNRDDGVEMCNQLGGRFVDTFRRENGRWLIKHRVVVHDWSISHPVEHDWQRERQVGLRPGARTEADPSYAVLGLRPAARPPGRA